MPPFPQPPTLISILRQRCPRCRSGSIFPYSVFRGLPRMYERCAVCNLRFEREEGYFLGAMYISYGLAIVITALNTALLWWLTDWPLTRDALWGFVLFLPLVPSVTLFSRVLWLYLDHAIDPELPE